MRILFISAANKQFDGRTRALLEILKSFAEVFEITSTNGEDVYKEREFLVHMNGSKGYLSFINKAISIGEKIGDIDCLFIDNRKATIPGIRLKRILNPGMVVYDARELYLKEEVNGISGKIGCHFEEKMISMADIVICANKERREIMLDKFKHKGTILVFENFRKLRFSENADLEKIKAKYSEYFQKDAFRIVSTAGCELARGTKELILACNNLSYNYELYLVGCKDDSDRMEIEEMIRDLDIEHVNLVPRIPQDELKYFITQCDAGVAIYHKKNANNLYCSSGKVYEYIYEGIPIAVSDNPTLANLVNTYGVGVSGSDMRSVLEEIYHSYDRYKNNVDLFINLQIVEKGQQSFKKELTEIMMGGINEN